MIEMRNILIICGIVILNISAIVAQDHKHRENFKAYKIAYITQNLDLSPEEAERFWPVYNDYEKKAFNLRIRKKKEIGKRIKEEGGVDSLMDETVNEYLGKLLNNELEYVSLKKKFYDDLKNIIPAKKVLKLYNTEGDFNRKVLSEYRKKRQEKPE